MIAELATIALATLAGWPFVRRLGEAFLIGCGVLAVTLFVASVVHVPWTRATVVVPVAVIWVGVAVRLRGSQCHPERSEGSSSKDPSPSSRLRMTGWTPLRMTGALTWRRLSAGVPVAATLLLLLGYTLYATLAPPPEFDFLADWGAKARVFFEAGTIDWRFLETASYRATHPDYPPLLPLLFDAVAVLRGGWSDSYLGLLNVAFAVSLLLIVYEQTRSALIVLAVVPLAATPWIGIAEGPFIAFATAALLLLRAGRVGEGAVLLGLAALTKNEGLVLIVAVAAGLAAAPPAESRRHVSSGESDISPGSTWRRLSGGGAAARLREILRLWPAVMIPLPWLILRAIHHLPTDVAQAGVVSRIIAHLRDPRALSAAFAAGSPGKPLFWIAVLFAVVLTAPRLLRDERFIMTAIVLQFLFYVVAYLATPHDVMWHVRWSWERLVAHLSPVLAVTLLLNLKRIFDGDEPRALARESSVVAGE